MMQWRVGLVTVLLATAVAACGGGSGGGGDDGGDKKAGVQVSTLAGSHAGADGSVEARIDGPTAVVSDGTYLYVADAHNYTIRRIDLASGVVGTQAGQLGVRGHADGLATEAKFVEPVGLALQGDSLYVADAGSNTIRKIALTTGQVSTLAGQAGSPGANDGIGTAATFTSPKGMIIRDGALYVADSHAHRIRKIVLATGEVSSFAGQGQAGYADGARGSALFDLPADLAANAEALFVSEAGNNLVRKIAWSTGMVTTLAGRLRDGSADDYLAPLYSPRELAADDSYVYVADSSRYTISRIAISSGAVTTLAGRAWNRGSTDGPATSATFRYPTGLSLVGSNLYISDTEGSTIRRLALSTGTLSTLAGRPPGSDGIGVAAQFQMPNGMASDGIHLYVADTTNSVIRQVTIATGEATTLAGAVGVSGKVDAVGSAARFAFPYGLALVGGDLYVADSGNCAIRRIALATRAVTTFSGGGECGHADGTDLASFNYPQGLTTDGSSLFVSDTGNAIIRRIVLATRVVTTVAGQIETLGSADGKGASASFNFSGGIATDGTSLFVADTYNHTIRKIDIATGVVSTLAGQAGSFGSLDGAGSAARFTYPTGVTLSGNSLYIADSSAAMIRKIDIASGQVTTVAGVLYAYGASDGDVATARFRYPAGIVGVGKTLFVSDWRNKNIRRIDF